MINGEDLKKVVEFWENRILLLPFWHHGWIRYTPKSEIERIWGKIADKKTLFVASNEPWAYDELFLMVRKIVEKNVPTVQEWLELTKIRRDKYVAFWGVDESNPDYATVISRNYYGLVRGITSLLWHNAEQMELLKVHIVHPEDTENFTACGKFSKWLAVDDSDTHATCHPCISEWQWDSIHRTIRKAEKYDEKHGIRR